MENRDTESRSIKLILLHFPVDEIETAFKDSIDDYLDWCKKRRKLPEKPFSGKLNLRMKKDLHAKLASLAHQQRASLNNFINDCLSKAVNF